MSDFANDFDFADFGAQQEAPQAPPAPPKPPAAPPRDLNPFGEPTSPHPQPPAENGFDFGGDGGAATAEEATTTAAAESIDPPTPRSPPPAPPIAPTPDNGVAAEDDGFAEEVPEEPLSPPPPTPPRCPPPLPQSPPPPLPLPDVAAEAALAAALASEIGGDAITGRRKALDETRLFEQRRNRHFGEKYDGDSLYWKCFVELIRRSQANNRRAINYATQKLSATIGYARSLYAIRDRVDGLDAGTTEARCEKERRKKGEKVWPPQPPPLTQPHPQPEAQQQQQHGSGGGGSGARPRPASALDCLFVMDEHTAMRTLDMCDEARVSVIDKGLNAMVKSLDDRFSAMVGQGTACLRLMHAAEINSAKAYARYQTVVTESLNREAAATGARGAPQSRDVASSDVWLADMNYRVAVTQQARVWKGVSAKLGDLFGNMKDIEVERRQAIQGGLTALMQLQDGLWRDLPALKDPVLLTLSRINVDRHLLDQEVRHEMRKGAARLLASREEASSISSTSGGAAGSEGGSAASSIHLPAASDGDVQRGHSRDSSLVLPPDFLKSLESPLDSSLIARSTMLERKEKMMIASRWILVLAILTHDSYLLLFDVPKGSAAHKKQLNARTSEAFAELVPKPEVDAMAVELGKRKDGKGLDVSGLPVPPSVAIDLSACQVNFKPDGKSDATFEITEIKPARGMKGVFKDYEESRFTLRGRSQEAMVDWVCEIKEMGRAGMLAVSKK